MLTMMAFQGREGGERERERETFIDKVKKYFSFLDYTSISDLCHKEKKSPVLRYLIIHTQEVSFTKNFTSFFPVEDHTGNWLSVYTLDATGFTAL